MVLTGENTRRSGNVPEHISSIINRVIDGILQKSNETEENGEEES